MSPRFSLSLMTLLLPLLAQAQPGGASAAPAQEDPYATVKQAPMFTIGGVGFTGRPSREELAFRELIKGPQAVAQCQKLQGEATVAGQLYGLLGLRLLDQKAFAAALPRYEQMKMQVETMEGCNAFKTDVASLAGKIAKGEIK